MKSRQNLEWEDEIIDKATGLSVKRKVIVTGSVAYGLPTASDADVLFALVQLTKQENNFTSSDVFFSRYEVLRLLDWRDEGKSYRRLEESFNRWIGTSIYFSAWRDKESETWQSHKFHILENVTLISNDNRRILLAKGQQNRAFSSFTWNKVVFRNLQAGFVCPVDLEIYFGLRSAISKRMLRYLGKHFRLRQQRSLTFDLQVFAFNKVGLSRTPNVAKIKEVLQPAIEELERIGFLEPMGREERYTKLAPKRWSITLVRTSPKIDEGHPPKLGPARSPEQSEFEAALITRGVTPATATELVAAFPAGRIQAKLEAFDWLVEKRDKRVSKNPSGYLAEAIRKDYAVPKGFESRANREKRLEDEAGRKRRAEEAKRREEAERIAKEDAEQARIRAYWETLSPVEQEELQEDAIANAASFYVKQYRQNTDNPERSAWYLKLIINSYIARILDTQTPN